MSIKTSKAARTTITRDVVDLSQNTGNLYESLVILSKRSSQINATLKEELTQKLSEFATNTDTLEEVFENREQIEISRYYERLPKPHSVAVEEFEEGRIYYRRKDEA
ncbi:MAG: DNA-directed RNA polymerase subunit K/omega [Luteibaculaceae bacterium]|jgi:DNA-directed RNA polymerase subunit K/omega